MQGDGGWSRHSNAAPDAGGCWWGKLLQASLHGRGNGSVRITGGIGRRRRLTKLAKVNDWRTEMDLWRPRAFAPVARAAKWFLCAFLACGLFLGPGLLATVRSHESILVPGPVKVNPKDGLKYVWVP